jgi:hypothetical protein
MGFVFVLLTVLFFYILYCAFRFKQNVVIRKITFRDANGLFNSLLFGKEKEKVLSFFFFFFEIIFF